MADMADNAETSGFLWRIQLLGGLAIYDSAGTSIHHFRSRKVRALLAYLALHRGQPCSRETLCALLWPEEPSERVAANRLRVALSSLRHQMEPPGIVFGTVLDVSEAGCIRLTAQTCWCDLDAFEQAWKAGRRDEAARLLRGTLLPGMCEEWLADEQIRIELLRDELRDASLGRSWPDPPAGQYRLTFAPLEAPVSDDSSPPAPLYAASAPPPFALAAPGRLPLYLTRFFGREPEMQRLHKLLRVSRLVTLCGPGGVGKTRLALEAARQAEWSCAFVSLAELPDALRLPEFVLQSLGARPYVTPPLMSQLIALLEQRGPCLLVIDNAEHLLDAVANLVIGLLEVVPTLHLLITSRQRLDVPGEAALMLAPLPLPLPATDMALLLQSPAVALFMDRARNARPDFTLMPRHVPAVADICRRLQGVPLALELAAARIVAQTPEQISVALSQNLLDLKSRQRGLSARHRSLRAMIQSSIDTLNVEMRRFWGLLSIFQGGWTVEAAQAVTRCEQTAEFLEELAARSLVVAQEADRGDVMRYSFLESLRQAAAEQLNVEERQTGIRRHAQYYLALAGEVREEDIHTLVPLDAAQENLRSALLVSSEGRGDDYWRGMAGALIHAFVRGHHQTAAHWIDDALPAAEQCLDPRLRLRLWYAACLILPDIGRYEQTEQIARRMRASARAQGDRVGVIFAAVIRGYAANARSRMQRAVRLHRVALAQARGLDDPVLLESCLSHATGTLYDYGMLLGSDTIDGRAVLQQAEGLARELCAVVSPNSRRFPLALLLNAATLLGQNRSDEAYVCIKQTQRACIAQGAAIELMYAFIYELEVLQRRGFAAQAAVRYGAFVAVQERIGYSVTRLQTVRPTWIEDVTRDLQARLGQETFDALVQRGRQTPPGTLASEIVPL